MTKQLTIREQQIVMNRLKRMVKVFDDMANAGCNRPVWLGYEDGNGRDLTHHMHNAIKSARQTIAKYDSK